VTLGVRPEWWRMVDAGTAGDGGAIAAQVVSVVFVGREHEVRAEVPGFGRVLLRVADAPPAVGGTVWLACTRAVAFPSSPPA